MTRLVLDCSVAMAWCFESEADRYADAVLEALADGAAVVPALWPLEVANVLVMAERRRRLSRAAAMRFLELVGELPVVVDSPITIGEIPGLLGLATAHQLSAYDAAYLHLAMREQLPLATRDHALRAAARATGVRQFARA
ncbi:MAG TPA: type II toxin-antitoxin system VapC family toxin [Methylomirabilota bacterium]|nr:type II toxin-antitoxin system VapC family toxin [Methylomirabilota bacterium]